MKPCIFALFPLDFHVLHGESHWMKTNAVPIIAVDLQNCNISFAKNQKNLNDRYRIKCKTVAPQNNGATVLTWISDL